MADYESTTNTLYSDMTDEQLIEVVRDGDKYAEEYLLNKYIPLVRSEIRFMYIAGADTEDLMQEGMIGLFKAIRDFDPSQRSRFITFADICIKNQVKTAISSANRAKHKPLNLYISLYSSESEEDEMQLSDAICDEEADDPESLTIRNDMHLRLADYMDKVLSRYERKVAELYLSGYRIDEIADSTEKYML